MTLLEEVKYLVRERKLSPNKLRGQNFCIDERVLDQIIKASEIKSLSNVLEIGPGLGFLTEKIQVQADKVIIVEIEQDFKKILETKKIFWPKTEIIWRDILQLSNAEISKLFNNQPYQIITNLPYGISGIFFRKFLSFSPGPVAITAMVQAEVGERLCATPGSLSLIGLQAQVYSQPQIIDYVEPISFWPKPKVRSAIIRLTNIHPWQDEKISEKRFWQIIKIGFSSKRKTLANNLAAGLKVDQLKIKKGLVSLGFSELIRAQELSVADWLKLAEYKI